MRLVAGSSNEKSNDVRTPAAPRCPACQLQLCKSREERPHAALTEFNRPDAPRLSSAFTCQTCGSTLVRSQDMGKAGWSHQR